MLVSCSSSDSVAPAPDASAPPPDAPDIDAPPAKPKGTPSPLPGVQILGSGIEFSDASSDQGGNIWGVTSHKVYFFRAGDGQRFAYTPWR